jgi:hypothetical protein
MKSYTEGIRALIFYAAKCLDIKDFSEDEAERKKHGDLVEMLTPLCKGGGSDKGFDACVTAIQVYGGYGFCAEYYVEQLARDCKITSIYEGTNGIQANDLLGRKLVMRDATAFNGLLAEIRSAIEIAKKTEGLAKYAEKLAGYVDRFEEVGELLRKGLKEDAFLAYSWASLYLSIAEDIAVAWMLLWQASVASEKLGSGEVGEADKTFYESKISTAKYFISSVLPQVAGKFDAIEDNDASFLEVDDKHFID